MPLSKIQGIEGQVTPNLGRRNLIINGDFQINQRGNGSGVGDAGYIGVDRWRGYISTSSTITFTQTAFSAGQSDVDKNLRHYLRFDWLGTGSATTKILNQRIEGAEKGNGQNVTLSFWGRTEQADDCTLRLIQNFGSGGSSQTNTDSGTIDLTTSWQYFTHTFALPSTSGKTVGTNHFLELQFIFGPATLNSYFDITGVQLEYGDTATDFEHRSESEELALCQRYYQKMGPFNTNDYPFGISGYVYGAVNSAIGAILNMPMRIDSPTVSMPEGNMHIRHSGNSSTTNGISAINSVSGALSGSMRFDVSHSSATAGTICVMTNASTLYTLRFDAEL